MVVIKFHSVFVLNLVFREIYSLCVFRCLVCTEYSAYPSTNNSQIAPLPIFINC